MTEAVIGGAVRTAVGTLAGSLSTIPAPTLGAVAISESIKRAGVPDGVQPDEVLMGNVIQAGVGQNPARQAAVRANLPTNIPATTINKVCGSGLKTVALAAQAIKAGDAQYIVAGGMENMSLGPYLIPNARSGYRLGNGELIDATVHDGLWCAMEDCHMGITAENVAAEYGVSREDQDAFSTESQRRAGAATEAGRFREEIVAVPVPQRRGDPQLIETDEYPRPDTTIETLARLRPAFQPDGGVTAGNASGINDGGAATVVVSAEFANEHGIRPLAKIRSYASVGVEPRIMGIGPVSAIQSAVRKAGLSVSDIDLLELNEAFAAQSVAVMRELELDADKVNVNGGAIAIGHPIGASGTRILITLLHEMGRREAQFGVAALCIGGGQGIAMVVEAA